jgi:hypothetical protein
VAAIGCGGQGPAAEALAVSTCLYQIEFSDQFQGLFAKLFLQKKKQLPISVAANHFFHFYS